MKTIAVSSPSVAEPLTLSTPVHFVMSADGATSWTIASNGQLCYAAVGPSLDGWVLLALGTQAITIIALDAGNPIEHLQLTIDVNGVAAPTPPEGAQVYALDDAEWHVSVNKKIGGGFQNAEILPFEDPPPPTPPPNRATNGLHFSVTSQPNQDSTDGLVDWTQPVPNAPLNALWTFSFLVPADPSGVEAYESDLVLVGTGGTSGVAGNRLYNFSGQYARVPGTSGAEWEWQSWRNHGWIGITSQSPGSYLATDSWHQLTIFYQRVTAAPDGSVYQSVPAPGGPDTNTSMLYAVAVLDGRPMLWHVIVESLETEWLTQVKLQHQIDTATGGVEIQKWVTGQMLTTWD